MVSFMPFNIVPYAQDMYLKWSPWEFGGRGWRNIRLGDVTTTFWMNVVTCYGDTNDSYNNNRIFNNCIYRTYTEQAYEDENLSWNYFEDQEGYTPVGDSSNDWWGKQYYW